MNHVKRMPRSIVGAAYVFFIIHLLAGCGPSIVCTQHVDGEELLKSLSDTSLSLEGTAQKTAKLLSRCTPNQSQQELIDTAIEKIAKGAAKLQFDFYREISEQGSNVKARIGFVDKSSLMAGTAKTSEKQIRLVEFEHLGTLVDVKSAFANIEKSIGLENPGYTDARQVKTEKGSLLLVRSTYNPVSFIENSQIRIYETSGGNRVFTPPEKFIYEYIHSNDNALNDYFFSCTSLAGGRCGVRDTRYGIDDNGWFKYVVSVLNSDLEDGRCQLELTVSRLEGKTIKRVGRLAEVRNVACSTPPNPDVHGDAFKNYSEQDLLQKLVAQGEYPDLADLVDMKRKDPADSALVSKLLSQGAQWKSSLFNNAFRSIDSAKVSSAKTTEEALKQIHFLVGVAAENLANIKWLLSNSTFGAGVSQQVVARESDIEGLRARLKSLSAPSIPDPVKEPDYPYETLSIAIEREVFPNEPLVFMNDAPIRYLGVRVPDGRLVVLYAEKRLTDRPTVIRVLASRGQEPMKLMFNGFPRDFWMYKTLSEPEIMAYESYQRKNHEYQQRLAVYENSRIQFSRELNKLENDLIILNENIKLIAIGAEQR